MTFTDLIRSSASQHEIRSLLTAYVDAVRHDDGLNGISKQITNIPLSDVADVKQRVVALLVELDTASKRLDHRSCGQIKEALQIFAAASDRMQYLAAEQQRAAA
jgi:hypothetical protein